MMSALVKPASGLCNIRCKYCFYRDEVEAREVGQRGVMSPETSELLIRELFRAARRSVTIAFQGGEPTLAGADYFDNIAALVKKYNVRGLPVAFSLQTNGVDVSDRLIGIFARDRYLVGVSVDGGKGLHDANRVDAAGEGTFAAAVSGAKRMVKAGVEVNLLSVLTDENARHAAKTYKYFTSQGWRWLQFIYSLPPLEFIPSQEAASGSERVSGCVNAYFLSPERWLSANKALFDLWYADICAGREVHVRHLENYLMIFCGMPAESCDLRGRCTLQYVVEADGSVYPCDFYALDEYKLGDIGEGFAALAASPAAAAFMSGRRRSERCENCRAAALCMGGCKRYSEGAEHRYLYCSVMPEFYDYTRERYLKLAARINGRGR